MRRCMNGNFHLSAVYQFEIKTSDDIIVYTDAMKGYCDNVNQYRVVAAMLQSSRRYFIKAVSSVSGIE